MNACGRTTRRTPRRTMAAFTLIEMLVVVAMLALITVGIARIFKSAGDTARAGKKVSQTNTYATLIERQLRQDIASMTRSGFLLIRNGTAGGTAPCYSGEPIRLSPNDRAPRLRRVDELLFFAKGDFASQRTPIHPSRAPRSTEAMIYYGHGLKWDPRSTTYQADLRLDDDNADARGFNVSGQGGARGPDQYAADWVLARRAFVLAPPNIVPGSVLPNTLTEPSPVWPGPPANPADQNSSWEDLDRSIQIGLQPAALSAFRILAQDTRYQLPTNANLVRDESPVQRPNLASGIVDVISMSLGEIRDTVIDAQPLNSADLAPFSLETDRGTVNDPLSDAGASGATFRTDFAVPPALPTDPLPTGWLRVDNPNSVTRRMQAWMRQALPANSDGGRRVRLEVLAPDWTGSRDSAGATPYDKEYKRTDQETLSAFNFVPHCTEFIVEWSFGVVYPMNFSDPALRGQVIWHGKERRADLNGDGRIEGGANATFSPELIAYPYNEPTRNNVDRYLAPYRKTDGTTGFRFFNPNLIRLGTAPTGGCDQPEYSYFGIVDPTWRIPSDFVDVNNDGVCTNCTLNNASSEAFDDVNGNRVRDLMGVPANPPGSGPGDIPEGLLGNGDKWFDPGIAGERRRPGEPDTVPWPWPKLIRVTMSIVDPTDPLNEQTFQFTFEVPSEPDANGT